MREILDKSFGIGYVCSPKYRYNLMNGKKSNLDSCRVRYLNFQKGEGGRSWGGGEVVEGKKSRNKEIEGGDV